MTFTSPNMSTLTYDGHVIAQYFNNQSIPQQLRIGDNKNMQTVEIKYYYNTVPDGFVGKITLGGVRIWEGTTVHDKAEDAQEEARKLLMTRMAKLFE